MGKQTEIALAETVNAGSNLEAALIYHFQANHYPALPLSLIPVAIKIINGKVRGNVVKLPHGITWKGRPYAPVSECIRAWHLDAFLLNPGDWEE